MNQRIIASIYTSEGNSVIPSRQHVDDYASALAKAVEYQEQGADEIIFMDVTPFNEKRRTLPRFLKDASARLNIPYTFGGGIHSINDVEEMLKSGAPRIYVNSAAVRNPELINKISKSHGSHTILVAIDTKKTFEKWKVYLNGGKSRTEIDLLNWVKMSEIRGAGEILVSTVLRGAADQSEIFDVLRDVTQTTSLPVLTSFGVSDVDDLIKGLSIPGIEGIVTTFFSRENAPAISEVKELLANHF